MQKYMHAEIHACRNTCMQKYMHAEIHACRNTCMQQRLTHIFQTLNFNMKYSEMANTERRHEYMHAANL
jgi:hypothetical protein